MFAGIPPAATRAATNYGLALNGSSQYVTFGPALGLGAPQFTLELWFDRTGAGVGTSTGSLGIASAIPLLTKGRAEAEGSNVDMNYFLGIDATTGKLVADFEEGLGGTGPLGLNHPVSGNTVITSNVWHHVAATYDGTWKIYLDGALDGSLVVNQPPRSDSIQHAAIGTAMTSTGVAAGFFQGVIDEARIWSTARTQAQIQAAKDTDITSVQTGLLGHWGLNEGAGTVANNTFGTAGASGALVGGPAWASGYAVPVIDTTAPAAPQSLVASAALNDGASLTWTANTEPDLAGYNVYRSTTSPVATSDSPLNGSLRASPSYTDSSIVAGTTYFYRVVAVDTSANPSVGSNEATATLAAGNYALQLNGSTQYSTVGSTANLRASQFTVETWFKRAPGGVTANTGAGGLDAYPLITKGRAEAENAGADVNYFFGIDAAGHLAADFEEAAGGATPSLNHPITGTSVIATDNTWHHAAATYDGTSWKLYLDGDLDGQLLVGRPANAATTVLTAIGTSMNTAGVAAGFFSGTIDEVRIWNVARSQAQIQATRDVEIGTSTAALLGEWRLNEGIGASLADGSGNGTSGVATGAPTWVAGFVPPTPNGAPTVTLDAPADGATGTTTGPQLSVTPTDPEGQAVTVTFFGRPYASGTFAVLATVSASPSGAPASTTWSGRADGQRYEWYVTVFDGSKTTTSPTWTFNTAPGVDPVLVGAGDIAGCATSGDEATSAIVTGVQGGVFTLGDNAYDNGLASEFTSCYGSSWGEASIKARTRPMSGNHDFGNDTNNGDGYFDYFNGVGTSDGPAGPRNTGIYSYDVGSHWHVVVLNSECAHTGVGCTATSPQATWLKADLSAHSDRNVIVMIHRPFISSGVSSGNTALAPLWQIFYDYGVDLVLSGHDHHYETFQPLGPAGTTIDTANGVREIIVGTGGFSETGSSSVKTGSLVRNYTTFGVLKLTLHEASFDWAFLPEADATFSDAGTSPVHAGANHPPVVSSVSISPAGPATGATLTASVTAADPDGDPLSYSYQWTKNGTDLAGATASTLDLATAGNGDRGDLIAVRATASDGLLSSTPVTSDPVAVANTAPSATVSLGSPSPTTNQTLTATATTADADGDLVSLTYTWTVDGALVRTTAGSASLTDSLALALPGNGDRGQVVAVSVTPSDGTAAGSTVSASATVANSAPTIASVILSPTAPGTDATVTATVSGAADADGDPLVWTFVWKNGATVVQTTPDTTSTADTLDLSVAGNGDSGDTISVAVTPSDGTDLGAAATDSVGVENQPPVMDSVSINPDSPATNQTMTATAAGHDPDGTGVSYTYQWVKNGTDIAGATGSTLNLATAGNGDRGDVIAVWVTASDGSLSSDPLESDGVTIANSAPTASVVLTPDPVGTDGTLTATATKADVDPGDTVTLTYVWKVNGQTVRTQATTALVDSLDLSVAGNGDAGNTVAVFVTPSDGSLTGASADDASSVISAALAFNGSSQYVTFGPATGLDGSVFTLEAWFNWTGGGSGTSTGTGGIANAIPLITKGRAEAETPADLNMNYFLGIDAASGKLIGDFEDTATGGNHPVTGNAVVTTNAWHHVAATYDGSTWRLYLDGVLDRSLVVGAFTPEATSIQHAAIGTAMNSTGVAAGFFAGSIDEARIWNVARTGAQIRGAKDNEITTAQTGLLGRWGLNEGSGTTAGNSAGSINGTLVGSPTWIAGYGFPQDTSAPLTPAGLAGIADDGAATLSWTANAETDLAGYDLYRSTTAPVDTSGAPLNGATLIQATTYPDTGLTNGTTYHYALIAVDASGNRSGASPEATVTPAGNGAPTATLVGPADGATGTTTGPQLSVTPTDPEGQAVTVTFFGRAFASGMFVTIATISASPSGAPASTTWSGRGDGQRYEWYVAVSDGATTTTSPTWTFDTAPGADPVLVGGGDIAYCPDVTTNTGLITSPILQGVAGDIFTAGDNVYLDGTSAEFANCYDPSWGGAPGHALKSRTKPAPGNHDWNTTNLAGYFGYFGTAAGDPTTGRSYYSFDEGALWHVVILDSECLKVPGGCTATSPQVSWFRSDLAANTARNVIVIWHKPRFSSGATNDANSQPFWDVAYQYGVDLILVGHDHVYERMVPMNAAGVADPVSGIPQITIGTGGEGHHTFGTIRSTSAVRNNDTFGVLKLTLHPTSFDWSFLPELGRTFTDSGSSPVNNGPDHAPTISSVAISPTSPTTAQVLTATVTAFDSDGDPLSYAYQWTRNGSDIAGATGATLNLATAGNGDAGDVIRVRATVSDGILSSSPATSSPVTIVNSAPTATVSLSPTSPTTNQTVTATATKADADGDAVGLTFVWSVAGTVVKTTSSPSALTDSLDLSVAGNGDKGQLVSVAVTPSDGAASGSAASSSTTVANSAPTVSSASITEATATTNAVLHAAGAWADQDGDAVTIAYQWTKDGVDVAGATTSSLDLSVAGNGDKGQVIRVRLTPSDSTTSGVAVTSTGLTIANTAPSTTVVFDGNSPDSNAVLTATATKADVDGDAVTLTYVWRVNGTVKKTTAATTSATDSFDLAIAGNGDNGDTVTVVVTPSDGVASGTPATATATVVADTTPPAAPGSSSPSVTTGSIALDWPDNSEHDLGGYRVYRGASASGTFTLLTLSLLTTSAYSDGSPVVGDLYYRVTAVDTTGNESLPTTVVVSRSIALRSATTGQSTGTTLTITKPSGTVSGDVVVAMIDLAGTASISAPIGWTAVRNDTNGTALRQATFWHVAGSSDSSYTFTFGAAQGATASLAAYVGVDTATPIDASTGLSGSGTAITGPSLSASANAVLIMVSGVATSTTITPASGMAERGEVGSSGKAKLDTEFADQLLGPAATTGNRAAAAAKAGANIGQLVALRASASPPPPPPPPTVPGAPGSVIASAGSSTVSLSWAVPTSDGGASITNYRIYKGTASGGETFLIQVGNVTSYQDTAVSNGTTYYYWVTALNSVGEGALSNEASARPGSASAPGAPTNLVAAPARPRGISLTWMAPASNGGSAITGYQILRSVSAGTETFLVSVLNVTSYKDTTATKGVTYYYQVEAINAIGASPPSGEVSATAR